MVVVNLPCNGGCLQCCLVTTDNFNRADGNDISLNSPCGWDVLRGSWSIIANRLRTFSGNALALCHVPHPRGVASAAVSATIRSDSTDSIDLVVDHDGTAGSPYYLARVRIAREMSLIQVDAQGQETVLKTTTDSSTILYPAGQDIQLSVFFGNGVLSCQTRVLTGPNVGNVSLSLATYATANGGKYVGVGTGGQAFAMRIDDFVFNRHRSATPGEEGCPIGDAPNCLIFKDSFNRAAGTDLGNGWLAIQDSWALTTLPNTTQTVLTPVSGSGRIQCTLPNSQTNSGACSVSVAFSLALDSDSFRLYIGGQDGSGGSPLFLEAMLLGPDNVGLGIPPNVGYRLQLKIFGGRDLMSGEPTTIYPTGFGPGGIANLKICFTSDGYITVSYPSGGPFNSGFGSADIPAFLDSTANDPGGRFITLEFIGSTGSYVSNFEYYDEGPLCPSCYPVCPVCAYGRTPEILRVKTNTITIPFVDPIWSTRLSGQTLLLQYQGVFSCGTFSGCYWRYVYPLYPQNALSGITVQVILGVPLDGDGTTGIITKRFGWLEIRTPPGGPVGGPNDIAYELVVGNQIPGFQPPFGDSSFINQSLAGNSFYQPYTELPHHELGWRNGQCQIFISPALVWYESVASFSACDNNVSRDQRFGPTGPAGASTQVKVDIP